MSESVIDQLDKVTGLWIALGIGFSKQIEYTITDILARWFTFQVGNVDLTVWMLYGLLWMGTLAIILLVKTLDSDG